MASDHQPPDLLHSPGSPPISRPTPAAAAALSTRDVAILPHILLCSKNPTKLQFDWDKLASRLQMKNPRSAANSWLAVRKKIEAISSSGSVQSPDTPSPKLTQNDQRFLANALFCTKRPLDVDYAALASSLGMKNPRSAANAWGAIRRKIGADVDSTVGGAKAAEKIIAKRKVKAPAPRARQIGLGTKADQLGLPPAQAPAMARPFSFKVVKHEHEMRVDEDQFEDHHTELGPDYIVGGMSVNKALSMHHIHMMAQTAMDEVDQDRVKVKIGFFDEC